MDFSYENERLVLTINCLQELDDIVKETEKRPKKVIVKNGARLTMTKIQQYFRQRCGWDFVGQWVGFSGLQKH